MPRHHAYTRAVTRNETTQADAPRESLDLDVEELRRRLGPVKVALIER